MYYAVIVCQNQTIRRLIEADSIDDARRLAALETIAEGCLVLSVSVTLAS